MLLKKYQWSNWNLMLILSINKFFWRKGGSETVFFDEKALLESKGHSVIPFSMKNEDNLESEYSDYFVEYVDYGKSGLASKLASASKIIYSFDARKKMKLLLEQAAPEVAHFHIFQHQISPSVFKPLQDKNIPIILTLHDLKPMCPNYKMYVNGSVCEKCKGAKFYNSVVNKCTKDSIFGSLVNMIEMYFHHYMRYYRDVDIYIAVSNFYREKMIEFGFPAEKISYLPNYIDVTEYEVSKSHDDYILYFGRLSEEKGLETFIKAATLNPSINHFIVGAGPIELKLKTLVNEGNISNVTFLGFKSGAELKMIISRALCIVVPSEWYENCPMSVLESFASARPVIGSNIGGIPELISESIDGLIFKTHDAQDFALKIKWMSENKDEAIKMGLAGRKKVEDKFNKNLHYAGLMSIYKSVLGEAK